MATTYNVSAKWSHIIVKAKAMTKDNGIKDEEITLSDFPANGSPISIEDGDAASLEIDVNGESYRKASLRPITVSLSLIPYSDEDTSMNAVCLQDFGVAHHRYDMSFFFNNGDPNGPTVDRFKNGILKSVQKGYTVVNGVRLEVRRYTFQFPPPGFEGN